MSCLLSSNSVLSMGYVGMQCPTSSDLWLSKGHNGMLCQILSVRLCGKRAMMACHARNRSNVCGVQGLHMNATLDIIR